MAIHVALHHKTAYRYDRAVTLGPQVIRLRPAPHCRTPILSYSLTLTPEDGNFVNWQQDAFSNHLARVVYPDKVREFAVTVDLVAEIAVYNPFDFFLEPHAEKFPFAYDRAQAAELSLYRRKRPRKPRFAAFVESLDLTPVRTIDFLVALNSRVNGLVKYVIRLEPGVQTPEQTLTSNLIRVTTRRLCSLMSSLESPSKSFLPVIMLGLV